MHLRCSIAALLCLCCFAGVICGQTNTLLKSENVTISPPDVYPPNGTFVGEVEVKIVANQPDANVYWTKTGEAPNNASRLYTGPISLFEPGVWQIQAIAIPKVPGVLLDSIVVSRTYRVLKSEVPIPTVYPPRGKYRGLVGVILSAPQNILSQPDAKIQYVVDVDDPGDTWQTYTSPVVLDTPGEHIIKCRVIIGTKGDMKISPVARYRYEVKPPLVYDVTTECKKCGDQPTLGKVFTVWLQSAEVNSQIFLTTSSRGCEMNKHILDDTDYVRVKYRQVAYRFVTYTEPQPKVYVCIQEPSHPNKTFVTIPRRIKASAQGVSEAFFSVDPAFGAVKRQATEAPFVGFTRQPFSETGSFSATFVIVFSILVIAMVATCATLGRLIKTKGYQPAHRVPKTNVVQDES